MNLFICSSPLRMMRNYILFFFYIGVFFSLSSQVKAQYVIIPDANFRTYLEAAFPSCMQGGMMDTTCVGITNAITVDVHSKSISDLTGIQYFDHLQELDCHENYLASLPPLPSSLITLQCYTNYFISLPPLPSTLKILKCYTNFLTSLPALPISLYYLDCFQNSLTSLPVLPTSLFKLNCGLNQLTVLPVLPSSLGVLICNLNKLQILPVLPGLLTYLDCGYNQLTNLPPLPTSLLHLDCVWNLLTILPSLPPSLISLICFENQLAALPDLPASLFTLWCDYNKLVVLPPLPSLLLSLTCSGNQLENLPSLPSRLDLLECENNIITCLPVLPNSLTILITDPLCRPNRLDNLSFEIPANSPLCSALTFTHTRVCVGDSTRFDMQGVNCHTFMWNFDDPVTGVHNTSTLRSPKHLFSHPGTFNVKLISYVSNPATVTTKMITVDNSSDIDFGNNYSLCPDEDVVLDAGPNFTSYLWQDGSVTQKYNVKKPGIYSVKATNTCGVVSDSIQLNSYELVFPNLFTPNQDIYNEYFEIVGLNGDAGSLQVYNSWGSEVYHNDHYYNDWNATNLPDDVYYYSFTLKSCPIEKGWVQITR